MMHMIHSSARHEKGSRRRTIHSMRGHEEEATETSVPPWLVSHCTGRDDGGDDDGGGGGGARDRDNGQHYGDFQDEKRLCTVDTICNISPWLRSFLRLVSYLPTVSVK